VKKLDVTTMFVPISVNLHLMLILAW
jgi:hypothetical protein